MDLLGGQTGFLELEVTYGRLSAKDLAFLFGGIRKASVRLLGLSAFHHLIETIKEENELNDESEGKKQKDEDDDWEKMKGPVKVHDTHTVSLFVPSMSSRSMLTKSSNHTLCLVAHESQEENPRRRVRSACRARSFASNSGQGFKTNLRSCGEVRRRDDSLDQFD